MLRGKFSSEGRRKGRIEDSCCLCGYAQGIRERFYVTSTDGDYARVYPMKAWNAIEEKLAKLSSHNTTKQKFLTRTNYYGQVVELMDKGAS